MPSWLPASRKSSAEGKLSAFRPTDFSSLSRDLRIKWSSSTMAIIPVSGILFLPGP
jgi:hypothetical protein